MKRAVSFVAAIAALSCGARIASADAAKGAGQALMEIEATSSGVEVKVCPPTGACPADRALPVRLGAITGKPKLTLLDLEQGRKAVRVDAPSSGGNIVAILAAPLAGEGDKPVGWRGVVGAKSGEEGEAREDVLVDEVNPKTKAHHLVFGERRDDVTICGRPAIVSARTLDAATMTIKPTSVMSLAADERAKAVKLSATKAAAPLATPAFRLLRATGASSAFEQKLATATDGDLETVWTTRAGGGAGEFLTLASTSDVPISSIEIAVRPKSASVEDGAAPKTFFLATREKLFHVTMPEDAWKNAGQSYEVKLPEPVRTDCVAVVLDEAYGASKNARVAVAEVVAHTAFDSSSLEGLVGALAGGGERAASAAALLARAGRPGLDAIEAGYAKLDDAGKRAAMGVVDSAPCTLQVPFFVARVVEEAAAAKNKSEMEDDPILVHARDRIRRCPGEAAPALAKLVADGGERAQELAAVELSMLRPGAAVPALLDAIPKANDATRQALRAALAHAAASDRATSVLKDEIDPSRFAARPEVAQIDFLRALGGGAGKIDGASAAFAKLAAPNASFRTKYLLLAPAANLARAGDANALAFLRAALKSDADAHIRARAAEVAADLPTLASEMIGAIDDAEPRVREAAMATMADEKTKAPDAAAPALAKRLASDEWTFARTAAARALAALPPSDAIDRALSTAIADKSADVRGRALDALGAHKAIAFADVVRERWQDTDENLEVRARAVIAIGSMCDRGSLEALTKLASKAKAPVDEIDRRLGAAAIFALGAIHPDDLEKRLGGLLAKDAPVEAREAAKSALQAPPACGAGGKMGGS